jgi:hypothetical protein
VPWRTGQHAHPRPATRPGNGTAHDEVAPDEADHDRAGPAGADHDQADHDRADHDQAGDGPEGGPRRYGLLLLLLIAAYLVSAFVRGFEVNLIQIVVFGTAAVMTLRAAGLPQRRERLILVFGGAATLLAIVLAAGQFSPDAEGIANIWTGLILLLTVVIIVQLILVSGTVTAQSIFGAVSAYMIIGLMFAAFYSAMNHFSGDFFAAGRGASTHTFQYFSFTTLTTLGYGDYTAAHSSGQAVAVIEALCGQVFLATLVARLVAAFRVTAAPGQATPGSAAGQPATEVEANSSAEPPGTGQRAAEPPATAEPTPPQGTDPSATGRPGPPVRGSQAYRTQAGIDRHGTVAARHRPARPPGRPGRPGQR